MIEPLFCDRVADCRNNGFFCIQKAHRKKLPVRFGCANVKK